MCLYRKAGSVFVWKNRKCVCIERQEVCLYGKAGSVFVLNISVNHTPVPSFSNFSIKKL